MKERIKAKACQGRNTYFPMMYQGKSFILTLAVLSIIITAPIGAILIAVGGPRLLEKSPLGNTDKLAIPEVTVVPPEGVEESEGIPEEVLKEA